MTTVQTPDCKYPATGWSLRVSRGPARSNFKTISDSGLYQFGQIMSALGKAGTYCITVACVTVNGKAYTQCSGVGTEGPFL